MPRSTVLLSLLLSLSRSFWLSFLSLCLLSSDVIILTIDAWDDQTFETEQATLIYAGYSRLTCSGSNGYYDSESSQTPYSISVGAIKDQIRGTIQLPISQIRSCSLTLLMQVNLLTTTKLKYEVPMQLYFSAPDKISKAILTGTFNINSRVFTDGYFLDSQLRSSLQSFQSSQQYVGVQRLTSKFEGLGQSNTLVIQIRLRGNLNITRNPSLLENLRRVLRGIIYLYLPLLFIIQKFQELVVQANVSDTFRSEPQSKIKVD